MTSLIGIGKASGGDLVKTWDELKEICIVEHVNLKHQLLNARHQLIDGIIES